MIFKHQLKNKKVLVIIFILFIIFGVLLFIKFNFSKQIENSATIDDILKAFLEKYPNWDKPGYFDISIEISLSNHAMGKVSWPGNERQGYWFAVQDNGRWIISDYSGSNYFGVCQNFAEYNFPIDMVPDCWDSERKILVNTSNPVRFYNGLTKKDKEKLKQAFINFRKDDTNQSRELFVKFNEYKDKYLKGAILIGGIENYSTPYFLAVRVKDDWKILYYGQEEPFCEDIEGYNIPLDMISGCWLNGQERISR